MENLFRKYGWVLRLALIALACLLLAMSVNSYIASKLAPYTVPSAPTLANDKSPKKPANKKPRPRRVNKADAVAKRCFFGCEDAPDTTAAPECPAEGCPEGEQCVAGQCVSSDSVAAVDPSGTPVASDMNVKLVGAMVSNKKQWSTALIQDPGGQQTYVVRVDDMIMGQAKLVDVKRDRIIIERNGRLEYIRLEGAISGNPVAAGAPRQAAMSSGLPKLAAPTSKAMPTKQREPKSAKNTSGVRKMDKGSFAVERKALEAKLKNKQQLAKDATIIPNYKNGKKSGLKLININEGSVYKTIGLQDGDVLQSVNGVKIRSQAHAMELMEQFREANKVTLELDRNGKTEQLQYEIN